MAEILHQLSIKTSPARLYHALTEQRDLRSWWTHFATAEPRTDSVAQFTFDKGRTRLRMKIVRLILNKMVVWHCIGGHPEWEGTQINFTIIPGERDHTTLLFEHRGWRQLNGIFPKCSFDWARYLMSLRSYLERGKGYPARD